MLRTWVSSRFGSRGKSAMEIRGEYRRKLLDFLGVEKLHYRHERRPSLQVETLETRKRRARLRSIRELDTSLEIRLHRSFLGYCQQSQCGKPIKDVLVSEIEVVRVEQGRHDSPAAIAELFHILRELRNPGRVASRHEHHRTQPPQRLLCAPKDVVRADSTTSLDQPELIKVQRIHGCRFRCPRENRDV